MKELRFSLAPEVEALGIRGACLVMEGMNNREGDPDFEHYRTDLFTRLRAQYTEDTLIQDPIIAGFRTLHDKIGRSNRRFPSSTERLMGLLLKKGTIASINLAVDIYNCVSLETRLSLGAHDVHKVDGDIALRMTTGKERFLPLGKDKPEIVPAGEYCYTDDKEILCRLEVRQADKTKVTTQSSTVFYMIQGNEYTSQATIMDAVDRLVSLTKRYCSGSEKILWATESG